MRACVRVRACVSVCVCTCVRAPVRVPTRRGGDRTQHTDLLHCPPCAHTHMSLWYPPRPPIATADNAATPNTSRTLGKGPGVCMHNAMSTPSTIGTEPAVGVVCWRTARQPCTFVGSSHAAHQLCDADVHLRRCSAHASRAV